ncbi:MAG: PAS domain-containing protein [Dehalococcoidia bacterium]|nr:PAS domain-containing protein [Dehalococcoidia bacterium]
MEMEDVLGLLHASPDGVYGVDMNQRVFLWNQAAEQLLGWKASEVVGKACYQVLAGPAGTGRELSPCVQSCLSIQLARRGKVAPAQRFLAYTRSGTPKWVSVTHVLIPSVVEDAGALVHIFHDAGAQARENGTVRQVVSATETPAAPAGAMDGETDHRAEPLTPRELEVLRLMGQGAGTQSIAGKLVIAVPTVRNHVQRVLAKLDVHTRLEAVALTSRRRLL